MKKFLELFYYIIIEARPRQWVKNFAVFVGIIFSGRFLDKESIVLTLQAFVIFCLLSSFTYYINDIKDRENDKNHPSKKLRPIASGNLSLIMSVVVALILLSFGLYWAFYLSEYFFFIALSYVGFTTAYSFFLKNFAIIEAIIVALGFVFRVMGGSLVISTPISSWLTVCTISLALLISFGRRKAEITLMGFHRAAEHRPVLAKYPKKYLEVMISSLSAATFISYIMFTYNYDPGEKLTLMTESILPDTLKDPKWMMITIPIAFYSLSRYLYLIYNKKEKGEPEKLITTDMPFLASIIAWLITVLLIIYPPFDII